MDNVEENFGPLANAYAFGTDEYKLIYLALNDFFLVLEKR